MCALAGQAIVSAAGFLLCAVAPLVGANAATPSPAAELAVATRADPYPVAGEPFEITISAEVKLAGPVVGTVPVPQVSAPDWAKLGLRVLSEQTSFRTQAAPSGTTCVTQLAVRVVADRPGTIVLPPVSAAATLPSGDVLRGQSQSCKVVVAKQPAGGGAPRSARTAGRAKLVAVPGLVGLALVPVATLVFVLWLAARRAQRHGAVPEQSQERELAELRKLAEQENAAEFYARAVPRIRQALAQRCGFSEAGLTTAEFVAELGAHCPDRGLVGRVEQCLTVADGVKFAAARPKPADLFHDLCLVETILRDSRPQREE